MTRACSPSSQELSSPLEQPGPMMNARPLPMATTRSRSRIPALLVVSLFLATMQADARNDSSRRRRGEAARNLVDSNVDLFHHHGGGKALGKAVAKDATKYPASDQTFDPSETFSPDGRVTFVPADLVTKFPTSFPTITTKAPDNANGKDKSVSPTFVPSATPLTPSPNPRPSAAPVPAPTSAPSSQPSSDPPASSNGGTGGDVGGNSGTSGNLNDPDEDPEVVTISSTAVFCPDLVDDEIRKEELWWQYSIELNNPAQEVDESQLNVLEISLRSGVSDSLLSCDNPTRRRRLEGDAGIIGIDYLPRDTVVEGEECPAGITQGEGGCFVIAGFMDLYLTKDADDDVAFLEARKAIQDIMSTTGGLDGLVNIRNVEYLKPELTETDALEENDESNGVRVASDGDRIGSGVVTLAALGCFFMLAAGVAAYRFKRNDEDDKQADGTLTIDPNGSQLTGADSNLSGDTSTSPVSVSPYSGMLPNPYRMNEPDTMSAILEGDSDSASQTPSHDIVVSDSGYTEEDSRGDVSYMQGVLNDPVLGAHKMEDYDDDGDYLFDTSADASDILPSASDILPTVSDTPEKEESLSTDGDKENSGMETSTPAHVFSA